MTFSNKAFRKFFDIKSVNEESLQLKSFFEKQDYLRFSRTLRTLSPTRNVVRFFQKHSLVHSNFIRVQWTLRGFFNTDGEITDYQFVGRDISELEIHRYRTFPIIMYGRSNGDKKYFPETQAAF